MKQHAAARQVCTADLFMIIRGPADSANAIPMPACCTEDKTAHNRCLDQAATPIFISRPAPVYRGLSTTGQCAVLSFLHLIRWSHPPCPYGSTSFDQYFFLGIFLHKYVEPGAKTRPPALLEHDNRHRPHLRYRISFWHHGLHRRDPRHHFYGAPQGQGLLSVVPLDHFAFVPAILPKIRCLSNGRLMLALVSGCACTLPAPSPCIFSTESLALLLAQRSCQFDLGGGAVTGLPIARGCGSWLVFSE